ncbi:MAG: hypothetical protein RMH81_07050 [Thermomicrobium sp.]|nr:hypothetical protein [Thermomicrobium sp.]
MVRSVIAVLVALVIVGCTASASPTPTPLPPTPTRAATGDPAVTGADRERLVAWADAWAAVTGFRAEITVFDESGTLQQHLQLAVVLPDRLHAIQLDPASGRPNQEWIIVGDAGWIKRGDNWQLGQVQQPPNFAGLYDPSALIEARAADDGGAAVTMRALGGETLDGVPCERWEITVTPVGQPTNRITLWIGREDQLPRQLRTEYPDGSVLQLRYWGYGEAIDIRPPSEQ